MVALVISITNPKIATQEAKLEAFYMQLTWVLFKGCLKPSN